MEAVRGSDNDDLITGDAKANALFGRDGGDTLTGGGGDDTLEGDAGNDTFVVTSFNEGKDTIVDFDSAEDTLNFAAALDVGDDGIANDLTKAVQSVADDGKDVTLTFKDGGSILFQGLGNGKIDTLGEFEAKINISTSVDTHQTGDKLDNKLTGDDGSDILVGLAGNDTLEGGEGKDFLDGGAGNDTFIWDLGDDFDILAAGTYNTGDVIKIGGDGSDFYDLNFTWDSNRNLTVGAAINDDFDFNVTGGVVLQNFVGVGGKASITVHIDVADNTLYGTDTDVSTINFLQGLTGTKNATTTEVLMGSDGKDTINGNGGYYDMLFGDGGDDVINGGSGRDLIWGQWDQDVLNGFAGDDIIRGGDNSDIINGGDGIDQADYRDDDVDHGATIDLGNGLTSDDGFGYQDKLTGIENIRGTNHDDTIIGDGGANAIKGEDGDDTIRGAGGDDTLEGGDGADTFQFTGFGEGNDTIKDFDLNNDVLAFSSALDTGGAAGILDELQAAITDVDDQGNGDDVVITFANGQTLTFTGAGTGAVNDITDLVNDPNTQIVGF
jgi:Ca2+-binding RTX toxin-like protein